MRKRFFLRMLGLSVPLAVGCALGGACSPSVDTTQGTAGAGGAGGAGGLANVSVGPSGFDGGLDALPDYVDPGCPDAGPPMTMFMCNPYMQNDGECKPGQGCYIFVKYPDEPCGQEVYGAVCDTVGPGMQGSPCDGAEGCGAGFVCVVSGSGDQCVELCMLQGDSGCADGLVCEPIDVEGFGGCL